MRVDGFEERVYELNGLRLAAKVWGEGYPCLALHGWLDNAASFDILAPKLVNSQVIAVDFPGHGLSGHRTRHHGYHFVDYVKDIALLVEHLELSQFDLLGHSMGGGVAALVAAAMPERVRRLVLLDSVGAITTPAKDAPKQLRRAITSFLSQETNQAPEYSSLEDAVSARRSGGFGVNEEAARLLCQRGLECRGQKFFWRSDSAVTLPSLLRLSEAQATAFIRAIRAPVCLILAKNGIREPMADWVKQRLEVFPAARIEVLTGGHHFHMEAAAAPMAEVIQAFLHK